MLLASDSEATLINIALDLQIIICTFLHPSDILALRETCKTLQLVTRQRVVWVAVLHRVCLDNSLFLPSFPILDMSDVELEYAAMGPRRWIELCASFKKRHPNGPGSQLCKRTTRIIKDSSLAVTGRAEIFIVPGGRYMVSGSPKGIFVWDLGYTSSADCKLIASVGLVGAGLEDDNVVYDCMVQATPDGLGLIIFSSLPKKHCSVYEIYPQNETPQLTHIAHLDYNPAEYLWACLLPDRVLWYGICDDRIVFIIWDYRANHSISFSADVDAKRFRYSMEVIATKTSIFVLYVEEILVWAIPPLSPQPPDFFDHNPTHVPSLFGVAFPDGIVSNGQIVQWQTMSPWYFGSSQPLYFDVLCWDSLHRFEIIVQPDLFDTFLHVINTEPRDFNATFHTYSICEDTLVACWDSYNVPEQCGTYTGLTSSRSTTVISPGSPATTMLLSVAAGPSGWYIFGLCPTSGRYVYLDADICRIVVVDLF